MKSGSRSARQAPGQDGDEHRHVRGLRRAPRGGRREDEAREPYRDVRRILAEHGLAFPEDRKPISPEVHHDLDPDFGDDDDVR